MTEFYDSARFNLIPAGARAALYYDGRYAATPEQAKRFGNVRWITVLGGAAAAAHAGAIDWELGNAAFQGSALQAWVGARRAMNCRARVYVDRANLPAAYALVGGEPNVVWWLSTLDSRQWTAADLLADVLAAERIALEPGTLWAIQWKGGPSAFYDTSELVGTW